VLEKAFQRESIDNKLRTKLWNIMKMRIWNGYYTQSYSYREKIDRLIYCLWDDFFGKDLDTLPQFQNEYGKKGSYSFFKEHFFSCQWFEVCDFLEAISQYHNGLLTSEIREWINLSLEEHNSAYRFVGDDIVEITDENEIQAIEDALDHPDKPVRIHLKTALEMLSDRQSPNYRNSIKESISAVEAACRLLAGRDSATLSDALKQIKNIHPVLAKAFNQLYGYTSDASGVRHSLIDEESITYADAKFMLVACSAFVSYLKASSTDAQPISPDLAHKAL
jgi:AbiJ N-terminal domain 4